MMLTGPQFSRRSLCYMSCTCLASLHPLKHVSFDDPWSRRFLPSLWKTLSTLYHALYQTFGSHFTLMIDSSKQIQSLLTLCSAKTPSLSHRISPCGPLQSFNSNNRNRKGIPLPQPWKMGEDLKIMRAGNFSAKSLSLPLDD